MEHRSISIADQIFDQLEREILAGKYARGEVISELGLSRELGVSRTPIREAIRRLEQEDFLEESGRGAVVVGISREDMEDMYEIRLQIEGAAARRAARNVSGQIRPLICRFFICFRVFFFDFFDDLVVHTVSFNKQIRFILPLR